MTDIQDIARKFGLNESETKIFEQYAQDVASGDKEKYVTDYLAGGSHELHSAFMELQLSEIRRIKLSQVHRR